MTKLANLQLLIEASTKAFEANAAFMEAMTAAIEGVPDTAETKEEKAPVKKKPVTKKKAETKKEEKVEETEGVDIDGPPPANVVQQVLIKLAKEKGRDSAREVIKSITGGSDAFRDVEEGDYEALIEAAQKATSGK